MVIFAGSPSKKRGFSTACAACGGGLVRPAASTLFYVIFKCYSVLGACTAMNRPVRQNTAERPA
jgi:hypothetical protein